MRSAIATVSFVSWSTSADAPPYTFIWINGFLDAVVAVVVILEIHIFDGLPFMTIELLLPVEEQVEVLLLFLDDSREMAARACLDSILR